MTTPDGGVAPETAAADPEGGPAQPDERFSQRFRTLTGVHEAILDWIPSERSRFTALAFVMIGTAGFSGVAMFFALGEIMGFVSAWYLPLAAEWAAFILVLDRLMIASSSGIRLRSRLNTLVPRVLVAVVIGFMVSEPLILRIFQPSIEQLVRTDRANAIRLLTTQMTLCNPVPGVDPAPNAKVDCSSMLVTTSADPSAAALHVSSLQKMETDEQTALDKERADLAQLQKTANQECNGSSGPGLTGRVGLGPACRQDQQDVVAYENQNGPLMTHQGADLASLGTQIADAQKAEQSAIAAFADARTTQIKAAVARLPRPDAPIGLGDRYRALLTLSTSVAVIGVTSMLLRVFFILVDCLPVLLKFTGGTTAYDRLAEKQVAARERTFERATAADESAAELRIATQLHDIRIDEERKRSHATVSRRSEEIEVERSRLFEVDKLWEVKLGRRRQAPHANDAGTATRNAAAPESDLGDTRAAGEPAIAITPITHSNGNARIPRPAPDPDQSAQAEPGRSDDV